MIRSFPFVCVLAVLSSATIAAAAVPPRLTPDEVAAWREDLRFVDHELRRHPLVFERLTPTRLTPARLDSAVAALDARLPTLARHEAIVGLMELVALVGAGHTSVNPQYDAVAGFRTYPLELFAFRDGIFVRRAAPAQRDLVGARLVAVGDVPVEEALARVGRVVAHENEFFLRAHGPTFLMMPEVAGALGLAPDMERLRLTVEQGGETRRVTIAPWGPLPLKHHDGSGAAARADWVDLRPASVEPPRWLRHAERRWLEWLPAPRTLYVSFQSSVPPHGHGEGIDRFFDRVLAAVDSLAPERLVVDVRDNLGGDSYYNSRLRLGIVRRPAIDQPGKLWILIGRGTYSAAQNLVTDFERDTHVTFAGEPTGSPAAFFGDHRPERLPRSGLTLNLSTLWWQTANPRDRRPFVPPALYAEPTAAEYAAGIDPVLDAVLAARDEPSLEARLDEAIAAGDSALARRRLEEFRSDSRNRYVNVEARVNALGYAHLAAGRLESAVRVLELNARVFPGSANVHDSVGEAYERSGRREEAITAYRRALAVAPNLASSAAALHRLGVAP